MVLSFADSDLAGLAAAWAAERDALPSVRLAHLRDLRHPMSVDLWIDSVARHAKVILVRLLGGLDWWRYGVERLAALARERGIALAVLPGEDRDDPRLAEASTLPPDELAALLALFPRGRARQSARAAAPARAATPGATLDAPSRSRCRGWRLSAGRRRGRVSIALAAALAPGQPVVPIIFYRSMLLAADIAPIDALCEALAARGLAPAPLVVTEPQRCRSRPPSCATRCARLAPAVIVTTTAFAAAASRASRRRSTAPTCRCCRSCRHHRRAAWADSPRGLGAADLAMHVVLPELDGRVLAGAIAFKDALPTRSTALGFTRASPTGPSRTASTQVADRIAALVRLQQTPRAERRIAVLMPDYPGAPGRTGYAVGLDVPASVLALLADLARSRLRASRDAPQTSQALLDALDAAATTPRCRSTTIARLLAELPADVASAIDAAWGAPDSRSRCARRRLPLPRAAVRQCHRRAAARPRARRPTAAPTITIRRCRRATRCSPSACGCAMSPSVDAIVHMGAHGTLEWLPGKAVALTRGCFPEAVVGAAAGDLSVHRQQSGRGRAGQAPHRRGDHRPSAAAARRRRICPATRASSSGWSTNTPRPTGSTAAAASAWRG